MNCTPAPEPYASIIDQRMLDDAAVLAEREVSTFERDFIEGEMWPLMPPDGARVRVTAIAPGVRTREFILPPERDR